MGGDRRTADANGFCGCDHYRGRWVMSSNVWTIIPKGFEMVARDWSEA
jgi:hypothetical protein